MIKKKHFWFDSMLSAIVDFLAIPGYVICTEGAITGLDYKDKNFGVGEDSELLAEELRVAFRLEG